jgi:hypothetical protein
MWWFSPDPQLLWVCLVRHIIYIMYYMKSFDYVSLHASDDKTFSSDVASDSVFNFWSMGIKEKLFFPQTFLPFFSLSFLLVLLHFILNGNSFSQKVVICEWTKLLWTHLILLFLSSCVCILYEMKHEFLDELNNNQ